MIAHSVNSVGEDKDTYEVMVKDGEGIVDGGHSYQLILNHKDKTELPEDQVIKFEILCGIPSEWIADIAGGLNTSVQVEPMSLDNLAGKFNWLKEELAGEPYAGKIAWRENDDGVYDILYLLSILLALEGIGWDADLDQMRGSTGPPDQRSTEARS